MIPLRDQEFIRNRFEKELQGKVKIDLFTQKPSLLYVPGPEECAQCESTQQILEELASLSEKVTLTVHEFADAAEQAKKLKVDKVPGIVLRGPANRALRFFGMPSGNEFPNFVETIMEASKQRVQVSQEATKHLKKLKDRASITVYVTPTCPHCPGVVRSAYRLALASGRVEATAVEIGEFPRLAQQLGVQAVPLTVINGKSTIAGALDEAALAEHVVKACAERGAVTGPTAQGGATTQTAQQGPSPASGLILPH